MRRSLKILCLGVSLFLLLVSASNADGELGFVPTPLSSQQIDSLKNTKEPTLQQILDGLGYDIDVQNDRLPTEVWEVILGEYSQVILEELGGAPDQILSGWYVAGARYDTSIIFRGPNAPPDSAFFQIAGCDSNGLFIIPYSEAEGCHYIYYTEPRLNPDGKDHAWVYCSKKRPNEFIVAWEDGVFLGDQDFNDLVLLFRLPNRPPVLEVPANTAYTVCVPETLCFPVDAYDPDYCGDTVAISKIRGPGTLEADTCCFLPDPGSAAYTFVFVATDWFGAADTDSVVITVETLAPPELVCPEDDSVHAGSQFTSTDFSVSGDKAGPVTVELCGTEPSPVNLPSIVESHVQWQTDCDDAGKTFTICLEATDSCLAKDTCRFDVTVYNQPPALTCPEDDSVKVGGSFVSTDYSVTDPDDATGVNVTLDSVSPTPTNAPTLVDKHVEWLSSTDDLTTGPDFTFTLIATDPCGAADTCDFLVTVYPSLILIVPQDDSVHAGNYFTSTDFSVTSGKNSITVSICGITPAPVHQPFIVDSHVEWQTECADDAKVFTICLAAEDALGAADTGYFDVTVYNRPPEITCPDDGNVEQRQTFISTDFSTSDPDTDAVTVQVLDISPSATNTPQVVDDHVEWTTTGSDAIGDYAIRLVATDLCGLADTCQFKVTVDEPTGDFYCPEDDSVHAGDFFVSTDFVLTYPECDPSSVEILDITPSPTHNPVLVAYHVEWQTTCEEDGDYVIRLRTNETCSTEDTCSFTVTVYNRPPELTCPDYGHVVPLGLFISTDFHVIDPDGDETQVVLLGIDPPAAHDPVIVEHHVEWLTECVEGDYFITLMAVDPCGLADTCEFMVTVSEDLPPDFTLWIYPFDQYVAAGQSAGYLVELNSPHGFPWPCTLMVSGLPAPPNVGVFDSPVLVPLDTTILTVSTTPSTPPGIYTLTVVGKQKSGPIEHSVQVGLIVGEASDVEDAGDESNRPDGFTLFQNQPNPFNPETQISYSLSQSCYLRVIIFNVLGETVKTLFEGFEGSGTHTLTWNGTDDQGQQLSSGIYFYQLQAAGRVQTRKMVLMK
jgi:hypothetical protein